MIIKPKHFIIALVPLILFLFILFYREDWFYRPINVLSSPDGKYKIEYVKNGDDEYRYVVKNTSLKSVLDLSYVKGYFMKGIFHKSVLGLSHVKGTVQWGNTNNDIFIYKEGSPSSCHVFIFTGSDSWDDDINKSSLYFTLDETGSITAMTLEGSRYDISNVPADIIEREEFNLRAYRI